ncbi:MAG: type II toxin-antitoxin system VapB family antitoxin [Candidatus Latescibacteria bacterium]|nr:type II toxin-antitoxin system VapB family antitoxin [Candidatus Latescibacterota bacterium]
MRATLNIPDELIEELMKMSGTKTKTQAICLAIEEYNRRKKVDKLLSLQGKVDMDDTWQEMEEIELKDIENDEKNPG